MSRISSLAKLQSPENSSSVLPIEFENVPEGYVHAFIMLDPAYVEKVAREGFKTENNRMMGKNAELETILNDRKPANITVDRTNCVFAYPRVPKGDDERLVPTGVLVEVLIDPKEALVADGETYADAFTNLVNGDLESAKRLAEGYWEKSVYLQDYPYMQLRTNFARPEVLIPVDIPVSHIRLAR
jgi:hypothetical protein